MIHNFIYITSYQELNQMLLALLGHFFSLSTQPLSLDSKLDYTLQLINTTILKKKLIKKIKPKFGVKQLVPLIIPPSVIQR